MSTSERPGPQESDVHPHGYNLKRAAVFVGIRPNHLRRLALAGHVASTKVGRKHIFTHEALVQLLKTGCPPVLKTDPKPEA